MANFALKSYFLWAVILIVSCSASREISGLLEEAQGLEDREISALKPLFEELQLQYDFVVSQTTQTPLVIDEKFQQQYEATFKEFEEQLNKFPFQKFTMKYDTTLPTLEEFIGKPDLSLLSPEQRLEFLDLQQILQDTVDDAQVNLNKLAARALQLQTILLKLNKPKALTLIFKALHLGYQAAGRIGRAAYCTYSHLPQLNTSLHSLYEGADCFTYATSLMVTIQNETHQTVKTVRKNIFELAAVYKKVNLQNSLMGKIVTVIMNMTKITKNILETIQKARFVLDGIENQLPAAAKEVISCGTNIAPQIPFVLETVSNVTECIFFKDETTTSYDFLTSEEEYDKNL